MPKTNQITNINAAALTTLDAEIRAAIAPIAEKYGVEFRRGRGVYGGANGSLKIEISTIGDDGKAITQEAEDYKRYASWHEMDPTALGREFSVGIYRYTIVGLKPKSPKYPVIGRRISDGKEYKFTPSVVKRGMVAV